MLQEVSKIWRPTTGNVLNVKVASLNCMCHWKPMKVLQECIGREWRMTALVHHGQGMLDSLKEHQGSNI